MCKPWIVTQQAICVLLAFTSMSRLGNFCLKALTLLMVSGMNF